MATPVNTASKPSMTRAEAELFRASGEVKDCARQLDAAVDSLRRRMQDIEQALERGNGWASIGCSAENIASAANLVSLRAARLEEARKMVEVLKGIVG